MASKIGITGRSANSLAVQTAQKAIEILQREGADFEVNAQFISVKGKSAKLSEFDCDVVLSFGGDGTLLETFHELKKKIPVMGINCGKKGFLLAYQSSEVESAIKAAISGKFATEERTRIRAKIDGKVVGEALNEVLIVPEKSGRLLEYSIKIGNEEHHEAGDGLILATPTGSTAHALSAGGPVVHGNAAVFVVVSINPVDGKHRPLVINDHEKIVVSDFRNMPAEAVIDGRIWFKVSQKVELERGSGVLLVKK